MMNRHGVRRFVAAALIIAAGFVALFLDPQNYHRAPTIEAPSTTIQPTKSPVGSAGDALRTLEIKGRAPKTDYRRTQFGDGWALQGNCDMRNIILHRDMQDVVVGSNCKVVRGTLQDPYTGREITFTRGVDTSDDVQIDHVVALSDAWQKGAQALTRVERETLANDPLELLAVDGGANQAKGDGDAATWLPPHKSFRCRYVARQIAVKVKYRLWVTQAEYDAMARVLDACPGELLPTPS